ncbi:PEP-CTERM sorting domain-containing protein [Mucisphaera sp.]|uniref:PEP-CTERM sorting domain-containing protein n=1 Tax=Mucisphaera sp. TaxID=2913024 RepID=UPI003D0A01F8
MRTRLAAALTIGMTAMSASGLEISYDGSQSPNSLTPDPFSFIVFGGTSWSTDGEALTLTTAPIRGIWFGNANHTGSSVPWQIGSPEEGNYLRVRAKLSEGADEWSIYLYDTEFLAAFGLFADELSYSNQAGGTVLDWDPTEFNTYEFLLRDGMVTYRLNESQVLYHGPANASVVSTGLMVIGDGSGSTPTGTGSMIIDDVLYISGPDFEIVPEPGSLVLLGLASLALVRRR